jgi:hypothetical protein
MERWVWKSEAVMTISRLACARAIDENGRGSRASSASLLPRLDASTQSLCGALSCCTKEIPINENTAQ